MATLTPTLTLASADATSDDLSFSVTDSISVTDPQTGMSKQAITTTGGNHILTAAVDTTKIFFIRHTGVDAGDSAVTTTLAVEDSDNVQFIKYDFYNSFKQSILSISSFYYLNFSHLKKSYNENSLSNDLAGPIGIVKNARNFNLDTFNGSINIFIAFSLIISLFNLFPIPLLDGGHILYFTISRIFSNSLPEFVTRIYLAIGITIISFIFIFVTFNDIFYK